MTDCFEIVSSRLLIPQMGIQTSVSSCTSKVLAISERNVFSVRRLVTFGEAEVDDVNGVFCLIVSTNQKVVGFDVPVNDSLLVDNLYSFYHLDRNVQAGAQVEFSSALLELVFETLSEKIHNHNMVHLAILGLLIADKMEVWHGGLTSELVNQLGLPKEHDVLGVLNCLFDLGSEEISSLSLLDFVDLSEGATSELLHYFVSLIEVFLTLVHSNFLF